MKKIFKMNIQKSYMILLGMITLFIIVFYYSYALFTVQEEHKEAIRIVAGSLYSKLTDKNQKTMTVMANSLSPNSKTSFTLNPKEERTIELKIENVNSRDAKFNLYYQTSSMDNVKVGYLTSSSIPEKEGFIIKQGDDKEFIIRLYNKGDKKETVTFGSDVGLANNSLLFPTDQNEIEPFQVEDGPAVSHLISKVNQESIYREETEKELYSMVMNSAKQKDWSEEERTDYRYLGTNPNNYAQIADELYRIVGIFTTKDSYGILEKRIKMVKADPIAITSYQQSSKNTFSDSIVQKKLDEYYERLPKNVQEMVAEVEWYIGDMSNSSIADLYQKERNDEQASVAYFYPVSLLSPSDYQYTYALGYNEDCFSRNENCQNSWMKSMMQENESWFLSYYSQEKDHIISLSKEGLLNYHSSVEEEKAVYPTFYLKSNIDITGLGTKENPYQFQQ